MALAVADGAAVVGCVGHLYAIALLCGVRRFSEGAHNLGHVTLLSCSAVCPG